MKTTKTLTYAELSNRASEPFEYALYYVFAEVLDSCELESTEITFTIDTDSSNPHNAKFEAKDEIITRGTITIDDMSHAVLLESFDSDGNTMRTVVDLENHYKYYFH